MSWEWAVAAGGALVAIVLGLVKLLTDRADSREGARHEVRAEQAEADVVRLEARDQRRRAPRLSGAGLRDLARRMLSRSEAGK